jgi:predicted nucleic acid-binding protein
MGKKVVRVFLDSNVILSGLLSDKGAPRILLDLLSIGFPFLIGLTGRYNLMEMERNIKKKMPGILSVYKEYFPRLNLRIIPLPPKGELREYSGKIADKDIPVLVSALRGKVDFLITGDKQHFGKMKDLDKYPFHVVTPSEFIDSVLPEILKGLEKKE